MGRKVLYSPGYGAGWSTWYYGEREEKEMMMTDAQLVADIESGGATKDALERFLSRFKAAFPNADEPYTGGFYDLRVRVVDGPFRITVYDGHESIETLSDTDWY